MRYYYILPFKAQYYFPEEYSKYRFLLNFFTPYSFAGSVVWWLWRKIAVIRYLFSVNHKNVPDLKLIQSVVGETAIIAINTGTKGPEQKTTAIGITLPANEPFFIKYARNEKARSLVTNEYVVLQKLKLKRGIPQILRYENSEDGTFMQTSFLDGKKVQNSFFTEEVFQLLLDLSKILTEGFPDHVVKSKCKKGFAHGDFCPWNMISTSDGLHLIDWEMAGLYPVGYDLFTFIFQTQFLLNPNKTANKILKENEHYINLYFELLNIKDWIGYLKDFAHEKYIQSVFKNRQISERFKELEMSFNNDKMK